MTSRSMLHKSHLTPFKIWLAERGYLYRPGRGDFQILQVQLGNAWHCIYERSNMPEHYTTVTPLEPTVRRFIRDYHKRKSCPISALSSLP